MTSSHRRNAPLARTLLSKEELSQFIQKRPWIVYFDLALIWVAIFASFAVLALSESWAIMLLAFIVIGTRQHALFIMGHDAIHHNLHPNRHVNDLLANRLIEAPLGVCLSDRRPNHMGHHRLLGSTDDPERHIHSAENKCEAVRFFLFVMGVRTFHRSVAKILPFIGGRRECSGRGASKPRGGAGYWRAHFQVPLVQLAILACVCATMPWWCYPLFWLLPIYVLVFVPDEIRGFTEHAHPVLPDSAMDDQRLITVLPGPLEAMFFSPRNMNYHSEHHLWPYIPYYNLPGVHQRVRRHPLNTTLVRDSYVAFLWRWFCELPLRSRADKPSQAAAADRGV